MSKVLAVIPSRFGAQRFPGKPLADLWGKPMVQHVWERCTEAAGVDHVVVATDDDRILNACRSFGADVVLTDPALPSGTDRVASAAAVYGKYELVLNVQGDEPAIEPDVVAAVARLVRQPGVEIGTAAVPTVADELFASPNVVKAVVARDGRALYFSRSVVPYVRNEPAAGTMHFRHLGIYGFTRSTLNALVALPPSPLEKLESLEQLRWLEAGVPIHVVAVQSDSVGIDTPEDLIRLSNRKPR